MTPHDTLQLYYITDFVHTSTLLATLLGLAIALIMPNKKAGVAIIHIGVMFSVEVDSTIFIMVLGFSQHFKTRQEDYSAK